VDLLDCLLEGESKTESALFLSPLIKLEGELLSFLAFKSL
jgi:hypothetical protein